MQAIMWEMFYLQIFFYHANSNTTEKWASVGCLGVEMESYALFATAAYLNKKSINVIDCFGFFSI